MHVFYFTLLQFIYCMQFLYILLLCCTILKYQKYLNHFISYAFVHSFPVNVCVCVDAFVRFFLSHFFPHFQFKLRQISRLQYNQFLYAVKSAFWVMSVGCTFCVKLKKVSNLYVNHLHLSDHDGATFESILGKSHPIKIRVLWAEWDLVHLITQVIRISTTYTFELFPS